MYPCITSLWCSWWFHFVVLYFGSHLGHREARLHLGGKAHCNFDENGVMIARKRHYGGKPDRNKVKKVNCGVVGRGE